MFRLSRPPQFHLWQNLDWFPLQSQELVNYHPDILPLSPIICGYMTLDDLL